VKEKGIKKIRQFQTKRNHYSLTGGRQDKIQKAELILSLDELHDSQSKASSHRKRAVESVSEALEKKRPHNELGTALILFASTIPHATATILIEEFPETTEQS
jgi:hypothetical protein